MAQDPLTQTVPLPRVTEKRVRYVRAPEPLIFPSEGQLPETTLHLVLRTFLFELLRYGWGREACVGSEQFIYWRASDPKTCLAPDAFVKFGRPFEHFDSWKTWERGTPELAIEVASESDRRDWDGKLERYRELGVRELVLFDPEGEPGQRLRVWDRVEGDLTERALDTESTESFVLTLSDAAVFWIVGEVDGHPGLRLARDATGGRMLLSAAERLQQLEAELGR